MHDVPFIRWDVLPHDSIEDLFLLKLGLDPASRICLSLASPYHAERDPLAGRIGSLEAGKGLGIGFPFP